MKSIGQEMAINDNELTDTGQREVLDNPVWNALVSNNQHLANGNDRVKYFDREVSPFAGLRENSAEDFQLLYDIMPAGRPVLFVAPVETNIPAPWKLLQVIKGFQMVCNQVAVTDETAGPEIVPLTAVHVPEMLALARLTKPGPFEERTIDFGHYMGIFENGKLAAMTGQRLHAYDYAEVSAVCTHPDYTGKGYARTLLKHHLNRISASGGIPILHVKDDNERAIRVYESLGFTIRTKVYFYVILKVDHNRADAGADYNPVH